MKNAFSFPEQSFVIHNDTKTVQKKLEIKIKRNVPKISTYFTPDGDGS